MKTSVVQTLTCAVTRTVTSKNAVTAYSGEDSHHHHRREHTTQLRGRWGLALPWWGAGVAETQFNSGLFGLCYSSSPVPAGNINGAGGGEVGCRRATGALGQH